jgi:hypothetical protein
LKTNRKVSRHAPSGRGAGENMCARHGCMHCMDWCAQPLAVQHCCCHPATHQLHPTCRCWDQRPAAV